MWEYNYDELYHHGIKGMRWGVRRFQNEDGSLTPAGEKRYGVDGDDTPKKVKTKSKHQLRVEENYKAQGYTQEEAEYAAKKRIRTQRILAASAAVAVTACIAYVGQKHIRDRVDGVIKAGEDLQRVEMTDTGGKLHDTFFLSKGKHDNARYKGLLGMTRQQQTGEAYLMKLAANNDVKVASKDKAIKAFGELYKNDPDFKKAVEKNVEQHFGGHNKVRDIDNTSYRNLKKMYDNFNAGLIDIREGGSGADKKFYDKLKSAGYGAIQDINDMKYSGYKAKNPLIVFDNSNNNIMVKSVTKMTGDKVQIDGVKELAKAAGETFVEKLLKTGGIVAAVGLSSKAIESYAKDYQKGEEPPDEDQARHIRS